MRLFGPPFSLRLGHASALTVHRTVIHYLVVASLPRKGRLKHHLSDESFEAIRKYVEGK